MTNQTPPQPSLPIKSPTTTTTTNANNNANHQPSITHALAQLHHPFKNKNQSLPLLPPTHTITRRPIIHAPIASPYASSTVPKIVYVSHKTPLIAAVKRVRKFLDQMEKRAMQDVRFLERGEREGMRRLVEANEKLVKGGSGGGGGAGGEEVLVRASGRAMAKAVAVGRWFEEKEMERKVVVQVRGGSVSVVDDVVEVEEVESGGDGEGGRDRSEEGDGQVEETMLEAGDTTLELFGAVEENNNTTTTVTTTIPGAEDDAPGVNAAEQGISEKAEGVGDVEGNGTASTSSKTKRKRKKKKRKLYGEDDIPEQRLRWIKTVEVAISFKA